MCPFSASQANLHPIVTHMVKIKSFRGGVFHPLKWYSIRFEQEGEKRDSLPDSGLSHICELVVFLTSKRVDLFNKAEV